MAASQNAKVVFEADTRDLTRGAQQARKDLKDFGKTSNDVASSIGDAFGVNTRQLEQMSNAAREMGRQLSESGNAGVAAFGKLLQSINAAKMGLAGIGIGAAITAFKALTAEAENFKQTVAGANIEMQTAAYVSTYTQVMHDFNAETGRSVAEFQSKWEKALGRFKANLQQSFVNTLTGKIDWGTALAGPLAGAFTGVNKDQQQAATAAATRAEQIAGELYSLQRQIAAKGVEWANTEAQIAEYRRIAKDDTSTLAQQQNAIAQASNLIKQRYGEEYQIRQQIAALQTEMVRLAGSTAAEEDKMYAAQKQAADILRTQETMLKSLSREQSSINSAVNAELSARRANILAIEEERKKLEQMRTTMAATSLGVSPGASSSLQGKAETSMQMGLIIRPTYNPKEVTDIATEIASLIEQSVGGISESLGGLIGDLATGGDAWKNFSSSALSAFGDMAVSVGRMAIATGVATLGIQKALQTLNGYVAIAAGAALVALGSAVKAGLGNIASGNYSASSSVASSSYGSVGSSGSGGYVASALNVKVSGTLVGDGNQLKAVIDTENSRRNTVT